MIVIKGDNQHRKLILEYFKGALNSWECNWDCLYYGIDHGIVMAYYKNELPKDAVILTYEDLLEL